MAKTVELNELQHIMEAQGTPSLKAIAAVFDLQAIRLYTVAKKPIEGQVWDPKVYNWDAIQTFIQKRLEVTEGVDTMEDVITRALELDEEMKEADGRRAANRGLGSTKKIEVDGKMIPERKFANFEQDAGKFICLKKDANVYAIVMQTQSHTVLRAVKDASGKEYANEEPKVISNGMLNFKGIGPAALDESIQSRFSGEYAKALAKEAKAAAEKAEKAAAAKEGEAQEA